MTALAIALLALPVADPALEIQAGAFGVTLFKPLYAILAQDSSSVVVCDFITGSIGGGLPEIVDDACLFPIAMPTNNSASGAGAILTTEW